MIRSNVVSRAVTVSTLFCLLGYLASGGFAVANSTAGTVIEVTVDAAPEKKVLDKPSSVNQLNKSLRIVTPEKIKALVDSGIYAVENDAIGILQNPTEALADFPTNRRHEIDWVKALDAGLIAPRANVDGSEVMELLDLDVLMEQTAGMPFVTFPHLTHTKWLSCDNCHNEIFEPVKNGNPITMGKILKGEYCGRCHDRIAFSLFVCEKCHNTAQ